MTDRELLEMAAKAADIEIGEWMEVGIHHGFTVDHGVKQAGILWNPLTDDGDALRLAVKLDLTVNCSNWCVRSSSSLHWHDGGRDDPMSATRLAIVRAAAEIGKSMQ